MPVTQHQKTAQWQASPTSAAGHRSHEETAARVAEAILALRLGREIAIADGGRVLTAIAIEHLSADALAAQRHRVRVLISRERARIIGHTIDTETAEVSFPINTSLDDLRRFAGLIDPTAAYPGPHDCSASRSRLCDAALELTRQAARVPALLLTGETTHSGIHATISADDVAHYQELRGRLLEPAARAKVQLARAPNTEFVVYRERFGDAQHVAVIVGAPNFDQAVNVRMHSACFTGDIFGSMRCDCGEQLTGAIDRMASSDGGIILYLDQEGRGIGLANKLRAYQLQAAGYDTIEADAHLGFAADGRNFAAATTMLNDLGVRQVKLLTNNPNKVSALAEQGIDVVERLPLSGTINAYNERYLVTKHERAGHLPSVVEGRRCDH